MLDKVEERVLAEYERGLFRPVKNQDKAKEETIEAAHRYTRKDARINISPSNTFSIPPHICRQETHRNVSRHDTVETGIAEKAGAHVRLFTSTNPNAPQARRLAHSRDENQESNVVERGHRLLPLTKPSLFFHTSIYAESTCNSAVAIFSRSA